MVYAADLKSAGSNLVRVRVPPAAQIKTALLTRSAVLIYFLVREAYTLKSANATKLQKSDKSLPRRARRSFSEGGAQYIDRAKALFLFGTGQNL